MAATFSETVTPNRDATVEINLTSAGAPFSANPLSAMWRAASLTDSAKAERTAKYPVSTPSSARDLPPRAKTSRQVILVSADSMSSPSTRAMSAMDRKMMVVEIGNSTSSPGKPKAPPVAPAVIAARA